MPARIQLRRAKGWRMPAGAVKVDRTTPWGNPFLVGEDGTRQECVDWFRLLLGAGLLNISVSRACVERQQATVRQLRLAEAVALLRGRDLACWCPLTAACHADVWLEFLAGSVRMPPVTPLGCVERA